MSEGFDRALATLERGATFLSAGLRETGRGDTISGRYSAKVIGNGLRELDRFLNILIDEALHARGLPVASGQRNTANKLGAYRGSDPDHSRLRALGRSRECLFHCEGKVGRGDDRGGTVMTAGWSERSGTALRQFAVGDHLVVRHEDLADICAFYLRVAREIGETINPSTCRAHAPAAWAG